MVLSPSGRWVVSGGESAGASVAVIDTESETASALCDLPFSGPLHWAADDVLVGIAHTSASSSACVAVKVRGNAEITSLATFPRQHRARLVRCRESHAFVSVTDGCRSALIVVDVQTGRVLRRYDAGAAVWRWFVGANPEQVTAARIHHEGFVKLHAVGAKPRVLATLGPVERLNTLGPVWDAQNSLWLVGYLEGSDAACGYALDLETGAATKQFDATPWDVDSLFCNAYTGECYGWSYAPAHRCWRGAMVDAQLKLLGDAHSVELLGTDTPGETWLFRRVVVGRGEAVGICRVGRHGHMLQELPKSRAQEDPFELTARHGQKLYGYLTKVACRKPIGLVTLVHDGPWSRDYWGKSRLAAWFAELGYVVCRVNYRGSKGYGWSFVEAANREWWTRIVDDVVDMTRAAGRGLDRSAHRVICGESFGGYAALAALARYADEYDCGVALAAPTELVSFVQHLCCTRPATRSVLARRIGGLRDDAARLRNQSPISHASSIRGRVFLAHGRADAVVPFQQGVAMAWALKHLKDRARFLDVPGGHRILVGPQGQIVLSAVDDFLRHDRIGESAASTDGTSSDRSTRSAL
jgi:pimeloyl-ACP methyl ester carboxylesterase